MITVFGCLLIPSTPSTTPAVALASEQTLKTSSIGGSATSSFIISVKWKKDAVDSLLHCLFSYLPPRLFHFTVISQSFPIHFPVISQLQDKREFSPRAPLPLHLHLCIWLLYCSSLSLGGRRQSVNFLGKMGAAPNHGGILKDSQRLGSQVRQFS